MTLDDIEILVRKEICDELGADADKYIKQEQIYSYANEAENEACRRARLLVDSLTTAICQIPVVAGTSVYDFDERIIFITRGIMTAGERPLNKASHVIMDETCPGWEKKTGTPETFVTGMYSRKLKIYKIPVSNDTLNLTVIRRPLTPMTIPSHSPEIPARLHQPLLLWIKHKAYNIQDSELFDKNRAGAHLAEFERYFGKRSDVDDTFDEMQLLRTCSSDYNTSSDYY